MKPSLPYVEIWEEDKDELSLRMMEERERETKVVEDPSKSIPGDLELEGQ